MSHMFRITFSLLLFTSFSIHASEAQQKEHTQEQQEEDAKKKFDTSFLKDSEIRQFIHHDGHCNKALYDTMRKDFSGGIEHPDAWKALCPPIIQQKNAEGVRTFVTPPRPVEYLDNQHIASFALERAKQDPIYQRCILSAAANSLRLDIVSRMVETYRAPIFYTAEDDPEAPDIPLLSAARGVKNTKSQTAMIRYLLSFPETLTDIISACTDRDDSLPYHIVQRTALHFIAQTNNVDAARLLIEAGASINLLDGQGYSPLQLALTSYHERLKRHDPRCFDEYFPNTNRIAPLPSLQMVTYLLSRSDASTYQPCVFSTQFREESLRKLRKKPSQLQACKEQFAQEDRHQQNQWLEAKQHAEKLLKRKKEQEKIEAQQKLDNSFLCNPIIQDFVHGSPTLRNNMMARLAKACAQDFHDDIFQSQHYPLARMEYFLHSPVFLQYIRRCARRDPLYRNLLLQHATARRRTEIVSFIQRPLTTLYQLVNKPEGPRLTPIDDTTAEKSNE